MTKPEPKYIGRAEAAELLMVHVQTILRMEKEGRMPFPVVVFEKFRSDRYRHIHGYDRKAFIAWAATNPVKHAAFKSEATRQERMTKGKKQKYSHGIDEVDIYNIRARRKPFVYTGMAADIILFCRNGLLSRHKYSSEE
jgi:hypothetical protein